MERETTKPASDEETALLENKPKSMDKTPLHMSCTLMFIFFFVGIFCVILYDLTICSKYNNDDVDSCHSKRTIGLIGMISFLLAAVCCCATCSLGLAYAYIV